MLRAWRQRRRLSQDALSESAEVSQRHLSRLETGKVSPSRQMVLVLASALEVPLRDRNALLGAAGFAAAYSARDYADPDLAPVRRALDFVLERSEPNPAFAVDRRWQVVAINASAARLQQAFVTPTPSLLAVAHNAMHVLFHPDGLSQWLVNWPQIATMTLARLRHDALTDPDGAGVLYEELQAYPLPERVPVDPRDTVLVPTHLRKGDVELRFALVVSQLGSAIDLTAAELTVETYHALDEATERWLQG
jgi:transcriptional regulator with XRE-family HTH domain